MNTYVSPHLSLAPISTRNSWTRVDLLASPEAPVARSNRSFGSYFHHSDGSDMPSVSMKLERCARDGHLPVSLNLIRGMAPIQHRNGWRFIQRDSGDAKGPSMGLFIKDPGGARGAIGTRARMENHEEFGNILPYGRDDLMEHDGLYHYSVDALDAVKLPLGVDTMSFGVDMLLISDSRAGLEFESYRKALKALPDSTRTQGLARDDGGEFVVRLGFATVRVFDIASWEAEQATEFETLSDIVIAVPINAAVEASRHGIPLERFTLPQERAAVLSPGLRLNLRTVPLSPLKSQARSMMVAITDLRW